MLKGLPGGFALAASSLPAAAAEPATDGLHARMRNDILFAGVIYKKSHRPE